MGISKKAHREMNQARINKERLRKEYERQYPEGMYGSDGSNNLKKFFAKNNTNQLVGNWFPKKPKFFKGV